MIKTIRFIPETVSRSLKTSAFLVIMGAMFAGCTAISNPVQFHVLSASAGQSPQASETQPKALVPPLLIGVGPITIPDYLNTSQMVIRINETRLEMSGYQRWAGLLDKNIQAVVIEVLSKTVKNSRVITWPSIHSAVPDYRISMDISRFEGSPETSISLLATVAISDKQNSVKFLPVSITIPVKNSSHDDYAAALSESLVESTRQIVKLLGQP
jgi:hypothetical protein